MTDKIKIASLADVVKFTKRYCGTSNADEEIICNQKVMLDKADGYLVYTASTDLLYGITSKSYLFKKSKEVIETMEQTLPDCLNIVKLQGTSYDGYDEFCSFLASLIKNTYLIGYENSNLEIGADSKMHMSAGMRITSRKIPFELEELAKIGVNTNKTFYEFKN